VGNELELFAHAHNWKRYFRRMIAPYIGRRVAEVGAGNGSTTEFLSAVPHQVWFAIEPDQDLLASVEHKRSLRRLPTTVIPKSGSISDLRPGDLLDTVLYIDVLEHIEDDAAELQHAADMITAGGYLVVLSPAYQMLYTSFDAAIGHYRRYTIETLQRITPASTSFVRGFYLDSFGVIASFANLVLLKQSQPTLSQVLFWDRVIVPCSTILDTITARSFGRSVVGVWRRRADG
jgi:SAM-dependent methyltransferase